MRFILSLLSLAAFASVFAAEPFDAQRKSISSSVATQSEDAIIAFLEAGLKENKPSQAHTIAQGWFLQNQPKEEKTLLLAAQVAENSAHFPAAVSFYQQYVGKADVKSKESQEAVMRLYWLMVDVMDNEGNTAYFYMLNNGEAFMPHGSARQYNKWVLDIASGNGRSGQAKHHDLIKLLTAVCRAGYSKDELTGLYAPYFRAAFYPDRRFVGRPNDPKDIQLGELYVDLSKAISHDPHMKAFALWLGTAWGYNAAYYQAVRNNDDKEKTPLLIPSPPLAAIDAFLSKYPEHGAMVCEDLFDMRRFGRDVEPAFNRKESDKTAKITVVKKYLPKMPPMVRYRAIRVLVAHDKTLATPKEVIMFNSDYHAVKRAKIALLDDKTPEAEREKEFRKLIADYDSQKPKEKFVAYRLMHLVAAHPSCWPEMMKTPERQWIFYRAVSEKLRINVNEYQPRAAQWNDDPPWTEPHFRKLVEADAKSKKIEPWILMAWINSFRPPGFKNGKYSELAAVPVMDTVKALPAYGELPHHLREHIQFGAPIAFSIPKNFVAAEENKKNKKQPKKKEEPPKQVVATGTFKEILTLTKDSDAAAVSAAIKTVLARLETLPTRVRLQGEERICALNPEVLGDPTVLPLVLELSNSPSATTPRGWSYDEPFCKSVLPVLVKSNDVKATHKYAYQLWARARHCRGTWAYDNMNSFQQNVLAVNPSAAATLARAGIQVYKSDRDKNKMAPMTALILRANQAMKLKIITVDESDPIYPVYKSQNEFVAGNFASAWKLFEENVETALENHRKLSANYMLWVLERFIDQRNEEMQERTIKLLRMWRDESATAFNIDQSITLDILYGDIAKKMGQLENAHKIYKSIQDNKKYAGVMAVHKATLRQIEIERLTKNFPAALQTCDQLIAKKIPEFWAAARYAKAEVYFDDESYEDAKEFTDAILKRFPGHKDATILDGKIKKELKDLMGASEIEIGSVTEQSQIIPGETLKVTLNDPTLAVGSGGTDIEVVVWSEGTDGKRGDEEYVLLRPFGDSKTKYRGTVPVAIGKPAARDKVLQVVGDDKVFFSYSDRFRSKVGNVKEFKGGPLGIVSDATVMASARKLLTVAEQQKEDAEALAASLMNVHTLRKMSDESKMALAQTQLATANAAKRADLEKFMKEQAEKRRLQTMVKPGNLIYLRVVDEDRSRTADVDEVTVSANSSSGDSVGQITLKETGTHTGIFEGALRTSDAQAMAFASSTRSGLNPNMVISPKTYEPWRSAPGKQKGTSTFTVDLNDNVPVEELTISVTEPEMNLNRFRILTGLNRKDLKIATTWPVTPMAKDPLKPHIFIVEQNKQRNGYGSPGENRPFQWHELAGYLHRDYLKDFPNAHVESLSGPAEAFSRNAFDNCDWVKKTSHPNHVKTILASRFTAYFYEENSIDRQFRVVLGKAPKLVVEKVQGKRTQKYDASGKELPCFVLINGRPLKAEGLTHEGAVRLQSGLQRFEIISQGRAGGIGFGRTCTVQTRTSVDEPWVDCRNDMFDPRTFPKDVVASAIPPADISMNKEGTEWKVRFAKGSRARVLHMDLIDHKGPEAVLNKLTLTAEGGKAVLPVPSDFSEQSKNETLEILTGDKIWIRYVDDRYVTKTKEKQERQLGCSFSDGKAVFADIEPRFNKEKGKMEEFYEPILQFRMNEPLSLVVTDADMDISDKPDTVQVKISSEFGKEKTITLTETADSNGKFRAFIVPVAHDSSKPNELKVDDGGIIKLSYWDKENAEPGVPFAREATIRHAKYQPPTLNITNMTAKPDFLTIEATGEKRPIMLCDSQFVDVTAPDSKPVTFVYGIRAFVDVFIPHQLLRPSSRVHAFIQTESARKRAARNVPQADGPPLEKPVFDITIPGTRMLTGVPVNVDPGRRLSGKPVTWFEDIREGYRRTPNSFSNYTYKIGQFRFELNAERAAFPTPGTEFDIKNLLQYATAGVKTPLTGKPLEALLEDLNYKERLRRNVSLETLGRELKRCKLLDAPVIDHNDRLHIGIRYEDNNGKAHWLTAEARYLTHGLMYSGLDEQPKGHLKSASLGDRVRVRVSDIGFDTSDELDSLKVTVSSEGGASYPLELTETEAHSGIFDGSFQLTISEDAPPKAAPPTDAPPEGAPPEEAAPAELNIASAGFPAKYGDTVKVSFKDSSGRELEPETISLGVGADGDITAFTKTYTDQEMAVRTQFSMAEAYLEVAKRYRKLKNTKESALAFQSAKRMLLSTIDMFTDADTRAHAEYLLGNLTFEEAGITDDPDLKEERYQAALARFHKVTANYPQSIYASKSQFKKAVTYEQLNEPNVAAQEYVKLAYRFPDSEHLAVALARLGIYFLKKGSKVEKESKALLAKTEDKDAQFNGNLLLKQSQEDFEKSAKIFNRLVVRFPDHELAPKGGVLSGKAYLRINDYHKALNTFKIVLDNESYPADFRSEAMYWAGICFRRTNQTLAAYAIFMRCTNEFPETVWSSRCLGELSDPALKKIDQEYELQRVKRGLQD